MSRRTCLSIPVVLVLLLAWDGGRLEAALTVPAPAALPEPARPAPGMFLVASRSIQDPDFQGSVVYLLQHDDHASLGVIVNRPTHMRLAEWRPDLEKTRLAALQLYDGGPVNPDMLLTLFENPAWQEHHGRRLARHVLGDIYASVSARIVAPILQDETGAFRRVRCYFGHIGWLPGQLEQEIGRHAWHLAPGDIDAVFGPDTATLWQRLIERLDPAPPQPLPGSPQIPGARRGTAAAGLQDSF